MKQIEIPNRTKESMKITTPYMRILLLFYLMIFSCNIIFAQKMVYPNDSSYLITIDKALLTTPAIYQGDSTKIKEESAKVKKEQEFYHSKGQKFLQTDINTTTKEISDNDARLQQINDALLSKHKFTVQQTANNNYAEEIKNLKTEKESMEAKQSILRQKLNTLNKEMESRKQQSTKGM